MNELNSNTGVLTKGDLNKIADLFNKQMDEKLDDSLGVKLPKLLDEKLDESLGVKLPKLLDNKLDDSLGVKLPKLLDEKLDESLGVKLPKLLDNKLDDSLGVKLPKLLDEKLDESLGVKLPKFLDEKLNEHFQKHFQAQWDKIFSLIATKEDLKNFYTKTEIDEKFNSLQTSVDGIAKNMKDYQVEFTSIKHSTKSLEAWAKNTGKAIGLEYTR